MSSSYGFGGYGSNPRDEYTAPDPVANTLAEALNKVGQNHHQTKYAWDQAPEPKRACQPYLSVTVQTDQAEITGRIFEVGSRDALVTIYPTSANAPVTLPGVGEPPTTLRISSINSFQIHTQVTHLPVAFPLSKEDFDDAVEKFLTVAEDILVGAAPTSDASDSLASAINGEVSQVAVISDEQSAALREAAAPIARHIEEGSFQHQWVTFAADVHDQFGVSGGAFIMPEPDARLNRVVRTEDLYASGVTSLTMYLTHGVPTRFLFPETHEEALNSYVTFISQKGGFPI